MSDVFAVIVPMENVNDEVATIAEWNKKSGSEVRAGDVIVTLETMKATFELEAEKEGFLFYEIEEGHEVSVGSVLAYICKENKRPEINTEISNAGKGKTHQVDISAKAEKLMRDYRLQREDFPGLNNIRLADVQTLIAEKGLKEKAQSGETRKSRNLPPGKSVKISSAKKYEIQQLRQSSERIIPSSVSIMVDLHKVEDKINNIAKNEGIKVTIVELIIYEIARLLNKYKVFNGFYDDGDCTIYDEINIGFAVNIGKGLKVPVINNADQLSIKDISISVKDLSLKYFREELDLSDLAGGTFTVTDLSAKGIVDFYPVINNMQSAILGVCSIMPGTKHFKIILAFDHNMADGMIAADLLNELSTLLQG